MEKNKLVSLISLSTSVDSVTTSSWFRQDPTRREVRWEEHEGDENGDGRWETFPRQVSNSSMISTEVLVRLITTPTTHTLNTSPTTVQQHTRTAQRSLSCHTDTMVLSVVTDSFDCGNIFIQLQRCHPLRCEPSIQMQHRHPSAGSMHKIITEI
jgi:hypothetical protein